MHPDTKNPEIKKFDEILGMIIDVCEKYGSRHLKEEEAEELWPVSYTHLTLPTTPYV